MRVLLIAAFIACAPAQQGKGAGAWVSAFAPSGDNAYSSWLAQGNFPYEHSYMLNAPDDEDDVTVAMHWSIDKKENLLRMAVAAEATGWLGFGLAEVGGMPGADMVVFAAADSSLTDLYATAYEQPHEDSCQDWTLVNSSTEGGFIIWEATRKLDTGDSQDRALLDDSQLEMTPTKIIVAHGDSDDLSFHGKNRFKGMVRFFSKVGDATEQFLMDMTAEGATTKDIKATSTYVMPSKETTYETFCMTASEMGITEKIHASESESCSSKKSHNGGHFLFHGWAKGNGPKQLPAAAGYPVGGDDGFKTFNLQIHYNNPDGREGVQDSSGFRIYFADQLRKYDAGLLQLGDPGLSLMGKRLQSGLTKHTFDCPSTCTQNHFEVDKVTVVTGALHAHESAVRMATKVTRSGSVIHEEAVDHYDFTQAGNHQIHQTSFMMQRGDAIQTTCYYNTTGNTSFGRSSHQEMCIGYFVYYPKQAIPSGVCSHSKKSRSYCAASYNWTSINEAGLGRTFGVGSDNCTPTLLSSMAANSKPQTLPSFVLVVAEFSFAVMVALIVYRTMSNQKKSVVEYNPLSQEEEA